MAGLPPNYDNVEIQRWLLLRAIEWNAFPAFASQPLVPIAFLLFSWYWVIATVVVLNILWSGIRYSYVNITAANVACLFVVWAKWPFSIGSAIYLFIHLQFVPGLIALFWPWLAGHIPPPGKIGVTELAFAKKIGYVPENGGVPQDDTQALVRWRKAADEGHVDAQIRLGIAYARGRGLPQDYSEAYFWLFLAEVREPRYFKQEELAKEKDEAMSHLTPADVSRELDRVLEWLKAHQAKSQ